MRRKLPVFAVGDRVARDVRRGRPGGNVIGKVAELTVDAHGRPAVRVESRGISTVWAVKYLKRVAEPTEE